MIDDDDRAGDVNALADAWTAEAVAGLRAAWRDDPDISPNELDRIVQRARPIFRAFYLGWLAGARNTGGAMDAPPFPPVLH